MDLVNTLVIVIALVTAALATAITIWSIRRGATVGAVDTVTLGRWEKGAVSLVGAGALIAVPLAVYGLIASAVSVAQLDPLRIDGMAIANAEVPAFTAASATIADAGYESVWLDVAGLPTGIRTLLWAETALPQLAALVIALAIAWLAFGLLRGAPFARALPTLLGVTAIVIVGAGLGTQVLGAIARGEVVSFLGARDITAGDAGDGPYEGLMAFSSTLDLAPLGWGLGLALVAGAFTLGARMQSDARGLV